MIVIPMAGLSRRFAEAGYTRPKFMLDLHGRSVFAHAVGSFARFFASLPFLFVLRDVQGTAAFVAAECRALGISDHAIVTLDAPTAGQADTVALGLRRAAIGAGDPVTIFNIDTFRPGFDFPRGFDASAVDGYLEVFRGGGPNWSYVRPSAPGSDRVAETAEKRPISDLCCTGLYHFARAGDFLAATAAFARERATLAELYVAPIYNHLIAAGADIRFAEIAPSEVLFCGVPAEYEALRALPAMPRAGGG
jgi:hypothetical protein